MSRSDSKIDLAKYMPSPEVRREIWDEEAAQERMRKAFDNPALDAALEEYRSESETVPNSPPAPPPPAPPSLPSPWIESAPGDDGAIDKALLPSASAPAAPPVTTPVEVDEPRRPAQPWSTTRKGLAAIAFAFLPAMLVFMLFVKPTPVGTQYVPATASVPAPPVASVAVSAAPVVSAAVPTPAPVPSVEPSAEIDAGSSVGPAVAPSAARPSGVKPPPPPGVPRVLPAPEPLATVTPAVTASAPPPPPPKPEIIN